MNNQEEKRDWKVQKAMLNQKFAELTSNDLLYEQGKKEEMYAKIRVKLGKTKEEFAAILAAL
jgi:uncharacterized protein YjbJ (UPF0337 family)